MLGSSSSGERINSLAAIERALAAAGLSFVWLGELAERGELPGERERLLQGIVAQRLRQGLESAWTMEAKDASFLREVFAECGGSGHIGGERISRAIKLADEARRRAGR